MIEKDRKAFKEMLEGIGSLFDKAIDKVILQMYWKMLEPHEFSNVTAAFESHVRKSPFFPKISEILAILGKNQSSHISANEAWAIALKSMDESETVVMTNEIMQARAIAWEIYESGDSTGARMAFRDAYERLIESVGGPTWYVSFGHDPGRRSEAVKKAVEQGLLPKSDLQKYRIEEPTTTVEQLTVQATDKAQKVSSRFEKERAVLSAFNFDEEMREMERLSFEAKRKAELDKISQRLGYDINKFH